MTDIVIGIEIRPYAEADWPRLCAIHDAARRDELALCVGVDAFRSLEDTYDSEGLFDDHLTVAELDGVVTGFAAFSQTELTWLYVDPAFHRCGVGRALLRHAVALGNGDMQIDLLEGNLPAQALYVSEGFRVTERRKGKLIGNEAFSASGLVLKQSH
ncbi:GNAT family N-acetyltransferase [Yoonia sp. R2-816]|uniref:GNAT family N-acetyltransferase n=1 Tax=Yoonia sp. R2-816 TaxID=3342638 RepID=UPI00372AB8FA